LIENSERQMNTTEFLEISQGELGRNKFCFPAYCFTLKAKQIVDWCSMSSCLYEKWRLAHFEKYLTLGICAITLPAQSFMEVFEGLQWVQVLSKRKLLPSNSAFLPNLSFRDSRGTLSESPHEYAKIF